MGRVKEDRNGRGVQKFIFEILFISWQVEPVPVSRFNAAVLFCVLLPPLLRSLELVITIDFIEMCIRDSLEAVLPFSNGLDSKAVAGLMMRSMGDRLVRIRLGSRLRSKEVLAVGREPFTSVPYQVKPGGRPFVESSRCV